MINNSNLKKWIIRHPDIHNFLSFLRYKEPKVQFILRTLVRFPKLHCKFMIRHSCMNGLGTKYPRQMPMNLDKPYYFNEKLMWLKYYNYNKNKLCEQCYDKFLVREFVAMSGCAGILNELYGVWDNVNDIPWDKLPDEYVIKRTNGCQQHIFRRKGELIDPKKTSKLLTGNTKQQRKNFITSGDLFATRNHQKYICEKLLYSNLGYESPEDYKFYCFNGEPRYFLFIMDRHDGVFTEAFKTTDFEDRSCFFDAAENYRIEKPVCYDLMLEICRKLSKPFPFVRVDLYVQSGKPVFGELTFTPAGGLVLYHTFNKNGDINYPALEEMGNLLEIR